MPRCFLCFPGDLEMSEPLPLHPGRQLVRPLLLILLVLLAFSPAIFGGYTWDDDQWLTQNPMVLYSGGISGMWDPWKKRDPYSPLIYMTFRVCYQFWGLHPLGYHLLNILLHAGAAILLWRILVRLDLRGAFL